MPEYAATRTGPRQGLPPAATGYEVAQVVKGPEPNDPYAPAEAGPSKANDLMQSLGILGKNIVPVALDVGKAVVEARTKKGAQARLVGDALDPNQSNAFIDGYERMDGSYRGTQFGNAAKEYAATNSHLPPDEFQKGLDALQTEYVGKLVHQGQLDTFLPEAIKGGEHATAVYQEAKNAAIIQERNQKVQDIYDGQFTVALDQTALDILKIPLSEGFKSIATSAANRKAYDDNKDAFRAAMSPQIRTILDDARSRYKDLGMTTRDLSSALLGRVGRMAADAGAPGLLDYAYQKNPADGNMSVETAFPDVTNKFADQARAMDTQINTAMDRKAEKEKKERLEKMAGDWLMELSYPAVTTETAQKIWVDVWNNKELPADTKEKIANHAADVMLGMGFARKDNQEVRRDLEYKIRTEQLVGDSANMAVLSASHQLSPATYSHLLTIAKEHKAQLSDHKWTMFNHEANTHLSSLTKSLGLTDDLGRTMINLDLPSQGMLGQVVSNAQDSWFRGLDLLREKNGGVPFDGAELTQLHDRITKFYTPQVEKIVNNAKASAGREAKTAPSSVKTEKESSVISSSAIPKGPAVKGIPKDWRPSGEFSNGKEIYVSPDGKQESIGN
jgi:hypothetical protein